MTFGKWLYQQREQQGITQPELAKRSGLSVSYISALERDEPNAKDGSPRRPRVEKIEKIAKALNLNVDEARLAAGFSPVNPRPAKPQTLTELIQRLEALGVGHIEFLDDEAIRNASPDQFNDVLKAVQIAIEVTLRQRNARPHATSAIHTTNG